MRYPFVLVFRHIHDLSFFIFVVHDHKGGSAVNIVHTLVAFGTVACVVKERQVLFGLSKGIWRYMDDVACCCRCVVGRKQKDA